MIRIGNQPSGRRGDRGEKRGEKKGAPATNRFPLISIPAARTKATAPPLPKESTTRVFTRPFVSHSRDPFTLYSLSLVFSTSFLFFLYMLLLLGQPRNIDKKSTGAPLQSLCSFSSIDRSSKHVFFLSSANRRKKRAAIKIYTSLIYDVPIDSLSCILLYNEFFKGNIRIRAIS